MERYIDDERAAEHRIAIQLMRHTLMHTGALRYLYDETNRIAYTWQTYLDDTTMSAREHYTLTPENRAYQEHLLEAAGGRPVDRIEALNLRLVFSADVLRAAEEWTSEMPGDEDMQVRCVANYSTVRFQVFNRVRHPG